MAAERTYSFLDDAESLKALVESMPAGAREEYKSYGALTLESAFPQRKMVVYTLHSGRPEDISILTFGDIEVTRIGGPVIEVHDDQGRLEFNTVPRKYRSRDLFVHVPQNFVLKWKGKRTSTGLVQFVPHYAVLVKSRSKEIHQVEGHTYCTTLNNFRERFPHLKLRY